jgi:hypothetical protein
MFPDLLSATQTYWQALDKIEADYKQGKLSAKEVDQQVQALMEDLGKQRRAAFLALWQWTQQASLTYRNQIVGLATLAIAVYLWWQWGGINVQ